MIRVEHLTFLGKSFLGEVLQFCPRTRIPINLNDLISDSSGVYCDEIKTLLWIVWHNRIDSLSIHWFNAWYVPSAVGETGNIMMNKTSMIPAFMPLLDYWGRQTSNKETKQRMTSAERGTGPQRFLTLYRGLPWEPRIQTDAWELSRTDWKFREILLHTNSGKMLGYRYLWM